MTDNSRNRYTVTLSHGGQAVKRAASDIELLDSSSRGSKKRPVWERLGSRLGSPFLDGDGDSSQRQRGDGIYRGYGAEDNARISEDDLRYKLLQKAAQQRSQDDDDDDDDERDLREKLIRMRRPTPRGGEMHQHISEPNWSNIPELKPPSRTANDLIRTDFSRSYSSSTLDHLRQGTGTSRGLSPPRNLDRLQGRHISWEHEDVIAAPYVSTGMVASRDLSPPRNPGRVQGWQISREYEDMRVAPHESRSMLDAPRQSTATARGLSPPRNLDRIHGRHISRGYEDVRGALHVSRGMLDAPRQSIGTARCLSPPRNCDRIQGRHISRGYEDGRVAPHVSRGMLDAPRQSIGTSRGLSSPRDLDRPHGRRINREYEDERVAPYVSRGTLDAPRQMSSAAFGKRLSQHPPQPVISNPRPPPVSLGISSPPVPTSQVLNQLPPPGTAGHRAVPLAEEHQTVDSLLKSLGLEKFSILFLFDQVDMAALKHMDESDLRELGIPRGPRKKILHALRPPGEGQ